MDFNGKLIYFPTCNQTGYVKTLLSKIVPTLNPVIMVDLNEFFIGKDLLINELLKIQIENSNTSFYLIS